MKKENWSLGLSIVAIAVSVVAICVACPSRQLGFDYQGVIVGVLSLLVTILIGWQIYTLIDIRKVREAVENEKTRIYLESERNLTTIFMSTSDYYYSRLADKEQSESELLFKYIYNRVSSILHASRISDFETCRIVVKVLIETIRPENIEMSESDKKTLLALLSDVKEPHKIANFYEFLLHIAKINEKP